MMKETGYIEKDDIDMAYSVVPFSSLMSTLKQYYQALSISHRRPRHAIAGSNVLIG
jgi:hypothetical protein